MGRETILASKAALEAAPLAEYRYPPYAGSFTGVLRYRYWRGRHPFLLCCFDTSGGHHYMLPAWWQSWGTPYSPKKTFINFKDEVEEGSYWYCTYSKKDNGYISWRTAERLNTSIGIKPVEKFAGRKWIHKSRMFDV